MTRRLVAVLAGAGVLLTVLPARAAVDADLDAAPRSAAAARERDALALLSSAAQAGRQLTYTGTQYVASWRDRSSETSLVELHHDPALGSVVLGADEDAVSLRSASAVLDRRMVHLLGTAYDLEVTGPGRCTGRSASVVEARRDGVVAGRFWIDDSSGLLLRREVFNPAGRRIRSMAFVDLTLSAQESLPPAMSGAVMSAVTGTERPARSALDRLRRDGWHVPERLPFGMSLFETRFDGSVLHLAYTDGLSTLSLFAQGGELGSEPMDGFTPEQVEGRPVWVRRAAPERVVWSGGGRVWTLVSDAPDTVVRAVVTELPRDPAPDHGVLARLGRGLSRLGGMANPFS